MPTPSARHGDCLFNRKPLTWAANKKREHDHVARSAHRNHRRHSLRRSCAVPGPGAFVDVMTRGRRAMLGEGESLILAMNGGRPMSTRLMTRVSPSRDECGTSRRPQVPQQLSLTKSTASCVLYRAERSTNGWLPCDCPISSTPTATCGCKTCGRAGPTRWSSASARLTARVESLPTLGIRRLQHTASRARGQHGPASPLQAARHAPADADVHRLRRGLRRLHHRVDGGFAIPAFSRTTGWRSVIW